MYLDFRTRAAHRFQMRLPYCSRFLDSCQSCVNCRCQLEVFFAGFQIISFYPDTCVEVYKVINGAKIFVSTQYFDQADQVYLYTADCYSDPDPTGFYVNASRPVGVIGGHSCAFIPSYDCNFCDYIAEQIPPISELGTDHLVPPILGRNYNAGWVCAYASPEGRSAIVIWCRYCCYDALKVSQRAGICFKKQLVWLTLLSHFK